MLVTGTKNTIVHVGPRESQVFIRSVLVTFLAMTKNPTEAI